MLTFDDQNMCGRGFIVQRVNIVNIVLRVVYKQENAAI